jgi:mycothiol synthase
MIMTKIAIRNYRPDDLRALVDLINETDAVDQQERATTLEEMQHRLSFPNFCPETDCFLVLDRDRLVGYTQLYVRQGEGEADSTAHCWGTVHPRWRRQGLGWRLMERAYQRAADYLPLLGAGTLNLQCNSRNTELDRIALFEGFGMKPARYWVNLVRPLNGDLPAVQIPAGIRLRTYDPERDIEAVWRVDNAAFRGHWNHVEGKLEEFVHWVNKPYFRPELWYLAEETATGKVVGLGLNEINQDRIARTGRREGYVDTVGVLPEHRQKGLGTALLVQSLHALQRAGMKAADLDADTENLTGAMRLYRRVGFRVRRTNILYWRAVRKA